MKRKNAVRLRVKEKELLRQLLSKGKEKTRKLTRCQILLLADEGKKDARIMEALGAARNTVRQVRHRYIREGLDAALNEQPRSGAPMKFSGRQKAKITVIACSQPPEGRSRWTLRLIADEIVELEIADSISYKTVERILKKTNLSLT